MQCQVLAPVRRLFLRALLLSLPSLSPPPSSSSVRRASRLQPVRPHFYICLCLRDWPVSSHFDSEGFALCACRSDCRAAPRAEGGYCWSRNFLRWAVAGGQLGGASPGAGPPCGASPGLGSAQHFFHRRGGRVFGGSPPAPPLSVRVCGGRHFPVAVPAEVSDGGIHPERIRRVFRESDRPLYSQIGGALRVGSGKWDSLALAPRNRG